MRIFIERNISVIVLVTFIIGLSAFSGCDKKPTNIKLPSESAADMKIVVWKVYFPEYISYWQEPLNRLLMEKNVQYTVKIEAYCDLADYNENAVMALKEMMLENSRCDVIAVPPGTVYEKSAEIGLLAPLDEFLRSEQGAEITYALPARDLARSKYNGVTYGISAHIRSLGATVYNKQLLDKYNIDVTTLSTDVFENEAVFQTIKRGEVGNVIPFMYCSYPDSELGMWQIYQAPYIAFTKQGKSVNIFETSELRELLYKLSDFKSKGLISFSLDTGFQRFFATSGIVHRDDVFEDVYKDYDGKSESTVETVVIPDMEKPQVAPYWGDSQTGIASWSQNRDNALDFLTRLYTDSDIANLIHYGGKGKNYNLNDNIAERFPGNRLGLFGENFTNTFITYSEIDTAPDKMVFQNKYYVHCEAYIPDGFRFNPEPVALEIEALDSIYYKNEYKPNLSEEVFALFTLNVSDIDSAMDAINSKLKEFGIDTVVREFDRQLAEWRSLVESKLH